MKVAIAAALVLAFNLTASAQEIKDETDRFTGARIIKYTGQTVFGKPSIAAAIVVKNDAARPSVAITVSNRDWQYLRCHAVHWLVDGRPLDTEAAIHSGSVQRGSVTERLVQPLSQDQFRAIGSAATVEYKVCNDEFSMQSQDIAGIREVLAHAPAPSSTGS